MTNRGLPARMRRRAPAILKRLAGRYLNVAAELMAMQLAQVTDNIAHDAFYRHGFHLLRKHYYLPIPDESDITDGFWEQRSSLPGLDMNEIVALDFLKTLFPRRMAEFRQHFPTERQDETPHFHLINGGYMAVDAHVYFSFIREFKPRRIIEIGAGYSTMLACAAGELNKSETGLAPRITAIEPYPWDIFKAGYPGLTELIAKKVQNVDRSLITSLGPDDILFIDSSHVLRSGNDVQYEYLEVLPRLGPGVFVHIHDISLPEAYPKTYYDRQLYWNEQYILQAFLAFNTKFEVIWPGNYMMIKYPHVMLEVFPEIQTMRQSYPQSEPSAFWMRTR
jgi:hypothetical protein